MYLKNREKEKQNVGSCYKQIVSSLMGDCVLLCNLWENLHLHFLTSDFTLSSHSVSWYLLHMV